ncbi:MAG: hemerythrin domain-containing protein [Candidatus Thorarchaeota archaeon]
MQLITQLQQEHRSILQTLRLLTKTCKKLTEGELIDVQQLDYALDFLTIFADKRHHYKEEELLFPAVILTGDASARELMDELLHEHEAGREFVRNMKHLRPHVPTTPAAATGFIDQATGYNQLLRQHILKEEEIFYPLAVKGLSKSQEQYLAEQFIILDEKTFGDFGSRNTIEIFQEILRGLET